MKWPTGRNGGKISNGGDRDFCLTQEDFFPMERTYICSSSIKAISLAIRSACFLQFMETLQIEKGDFNESACLEKKKYSFSFDRFDFCFRSDGRGLSVAF